MSKIEINLKEKKGYIRDVVFLYTQVQTAVINHSDAAKKEYKTDIVVDEDTADAWEKAFPKNSYKKIKTSEFKDKYKIDPPNPEDKNHFVISVKANALLKGDCNEFKKGDLVPYGFKGRPKIFVPDGEGVKDITMDVLVANGSKGDLSFAISVVDKGAFPGTYPYLSNMLVKELIEYKRGESSCDFGKVTNVARYEEKPKSANTVADSFDKSEPDFDDDVPY